MKRKTKEPAGYLFTPFPLVFNPGNLGEGMCDYDVFVTGRFVVPPSDLPSVVPRDPRIECLTEYIQCVGSWEVQLRPQWESLSVSLVDVLKDSWRRVFCHEVGKDVKATQGRGCCELF